jgi:hypothetical protein
MIFHFQRISCSPVSSLLKLVPAQLLIDGDLPDPDTAVEFTVKLKAPAAAAGAGR